MNAKILLTLLMIGSLFNYRVAFFGMSDILIFLCLFTLIITKNLRITPLTLFIMSFFTLLYLLGGLLAGYSSDRGLLNFIGFGYKYIFIFAIFIFCSNLKLDKIFIENLVFFTWLLMILWCFYYATSILASADLSSPNQISFPGTGKNNSSGPDSHLYAYVLGALGFFLFLNGYKFKFPILLITLLGIFMTGSRNPLALLLLVFIIHLFKNKPHQSLGILVTVSLLFLSSYVALFPFLEEYLPTMRSFNFDVANDQSMGNRIAKLSIAMQEYSYSYLLFGQSALVSSITWADGMHTMLLIHFGPIGLISYLLFLSYFLIKVSMLENNGTFSRGTLYYSIYLFFGLFITEFILVSRGAVLVLLPLFCLLQNKDQFHKTPSIN
tara:strand:- start:2736 stop:3878 length:1143 start_codon:yes stop_codon:yes gene_type:complete